MKPKKSSMLKRVAICVLSLIIGGIGGYLLAHHQFHKNTMDGKTPHKPDIDSMFYNSMDNFRHKEKHMENMFNDMERQLHEREKDILDNGSDFEKLEDLEGNTKSSGTFYYYQKRNNNGEESSYNVNGKRNDGKEGGTINMSGTNVEGKDFFYSGSIHNGKSQGTLIDEDGNTKDIDLQQLDLKEIYNDSNSLSK